MARHRDWTSTAGNPCAWHAVVTPSDTTVLDPVPRTIVVEAGSGTLLIEDEAGTVVAYTVAAGREIPFAAYRIRATATIGGTPMTTSGGLTIIAWW